MTKKNIKKSYTYSITEKPILQWDGGGEWILQRDFSYTTPDGKFTVPKYLITDFASVPKALRVFFSYKALLSRSALIHDWLYTSSTVNRKKADEIFYHLLKSEGINVPTRYVFYWAVRMFGGRYYENSSVRLDKAKK